MGKIKDFTKFYREMDSILRAPWVNLKWRIFIALLSAIFMMFCWQYIIERYSGYMCAEFPCPNTIFYWFVMGVISGIVMFMLISEGEIIIALWKKMHIFKEEQGIEKKPKKRAKKKK